MEVVVNTTLVEGSPTAAVEEGARVAMTSSRVDRVDRVEAVEVAGKLVINLTRPTFAHDNVNERTDRMTKQTRSTDNSREDTIVRKYLAASII